MFDTINKNIIEILGINTMPPEKQVEAIERLGAIVYQEVMLRVIETLSEEEKVAFEAFLETNPDPEKLFAFLSEKVPNINDIVEEEARSLREESASIMSEIGK